MEKLNDLISKLDNFDIWEVAKPVFEDLAPELIELNKSQLMEGKKSDGTNTPTYSQKYQAYKMTFSNYTSAPYANLNKTGDFFSGMYMKVVDQGLEFGSTDEKESDLEVYATKLIWGISEQGFTEIKPKARQNLEVELKKYFNL